MEVLADPARMGSVSLVDGLAAALLSMLILTPLANLAGSFLAGIMVGPVLGLAVGVGLWRQALIDHVNGLAHWPGGVAAGVVAGLLLGNLVNFGGLGVRSGGNEVVAVATMVVMGVGSVALSAGTGRIWADAAARLPGGRASWAAGVLENSVFFGLALWAIGWFPNFYDTAAEFGLPFEVLVIGGTALIGPVSLLALVPAAIAVFGLVARRRVLPVPQWLVDGPQTGPAESARRPGLAAVLLSGLAAGQMANFAVLVHRLAVGSPVDDDDRFGRYFLWVSTVVLVSLAVSLVTLAAVPRSGPPVALLSGAIAAASGALGILTINTFAFGNPLIVSFWWTAISSMTGVWFIGYLVILPVTLVSWSASWRDVPGPILLLLAAVAALFTSLIVVGAALALRQV
jgi:hypothetical protein